MAERVACTGFWAAFRTATSGFEAGLVAAFAAGRLERLIVDFFMGEIMGEGTAGSKRGEARPGAGFAPGAFVPRFRWGAGSARFPRPDLNATRTERESFVLRRAVCLRGSGLV